MQARTKQNVGTLFVCVLIASGLLMSCDQIKEDGSSEVQVPNGSSEVQVPVEIWRPLFNGENLDGWSGVNGTKIGDGWKVIDGALVLTEGGAGEIVTEEKFKDFELRLEWKISEKGNSGIFYRAASGEDAIWMSALEYQILDDASYPELKGSNEVAGSLFGLYASVGTKVKPVGQFNLTRIRVEGDRVEHWLNGQKVLSFDFSSDDWKTRLENSKFSDFESFSRVNLGHIALQDHGDVVWFKNIKLRKL